MESENNSTTNQHPNKSTNIALVMVMLLMALLLLGGYYIYENYFVGVPPKPNNPSARDNALEIVTANTWTWTETKMSDDTVVKAANPKRFVLTFKNDGTFGTTTDCNSGSGSYTIADGGRLTFGEIATTQMYCDGSSESEYYNELSNVTGYSMKDDNLYMTLELGSGTMEFIPVEQ